MEKIMLQDAYPVHTLYLDKANTKAETIDEVVAHLRERIEADSRAAHIADFDHYSHTMSHPEPEVAENIRDARNVIFCFGLRLPAPEVTAIRPRSIGVVETDTQFVMSFLEAPMPFANDAMSTWIEELAKQPQHA
ncbi:DUF6858 family protein [Halorhodospira neutriphila]|uniref:Uncharacterized protein n=1 Tax=Halorhodospira neutriphila TaxID=168379 RepID=A0ABS1E6E2_9GAMM|nr:hypothetical protein [Halorhodospira neutriphila]MBK1726782.1 hypothetical protein [Halorhodospira neutriphila]